MTVLVDWQIEQRCLTESMVSPFDSRLLNPCSIDIRIGETAKLRILGGWKDIDLTIHTEQNPYLLAPGDRVLVASLEIFNFPDDVAGQFRLKSSRGREFYEHLEAGWIDPGWHGSKLTMELIAHDIEPLPLLLRVANGSNYLFPINRKASQVLRRDGSLQWR